MMQDPNANVTVKITKDDNGNKVAPEMTNVELMILVDRQLQLL